MTIYAFFQTKAINKGVDLTVVGIEDGLVLKEDFLVIYGNAKHANHLTLNGQEILINEDNDFRQELLLSPGYNIITIEATDRFSKKTKEIYRVMYEKDA